MNCLTSANGLHIIRITRMLLGCTGQCSVFTHISQNGARVRHGRHAPVLLVCQGTAESELQGTGLLNIAGEKAGYSGILGHPTVLKIKSSYGCSFL